MRVATVTKKAYFSHNGVIYKLSATGQSGGGKVAVTEVKTGREKHIKGTEECFLIDPEDYVDVDDDTEEEDAPFPINVSIDFDREELTELGREVHTRFPVEITEEIKLVTNQENEDGSNDCADGCGCEDNTEEQLDSDPDGESKRKSWWDRSSD